MVRHTLQQQVPVYHVCQQCNGAGCAACSDLCILDGELVRSETIPQRVARYNSGRNRLLALRMLKSSLVNPDLYCPRCFQSKSPLRSTCSRSSCVASK